MTLADFEKHVRERGVYETIYDDTEGRRIVVMRLLDMYALFNSLRANEALERKAQNARELGLTYD
jgi:hypothetical protein